MMLRRAALVAVVCVTALGGVNTADGVSRSLLCFFAPGSAELTDSCKQVIRETAATWFKFSPKHSYRLEVRGYAQEADIPQSNDRLSALRALAVAGELRRQGIPDEHITAIGFGAENPIVSDAPLDPQNRRAWIIYRWR